MPKLQRIKRSNGSLVFSVNIPLEIIEELELEKGTQLTLEIGEVSGRKNIIIFREEDEINEGGKKSDG